MVRQNAVLTCYFSVAYDFLLLEFTVFSVAPYNIKNGEMLY